MPCSRWYLLDASHGGIALRSARVFLIELLSRMVGMNFVYDDAMNSRKELSMRVEKVRHGYGSLNYRYFR